VSRLDVKETGMRTEGAEFPWRFLTLHLSYRCNNDCQFCITGPRDPAGDALALEVIESFLSTYGSTEFEAVNLCGGEPTLRSDLARVVAVARGRGFRRVTIFTNGRRLAYRPYAEELVRAGVDYFTISLHGPGAVVHDALTRRPGSFRQALAAIRNLKSLQQIVQVLCVVTRQNHRLLRELLALAEAEGVDQVNLSGMCPYGQAAANWTEVGVTYEEIALQLTELAPAFTNPRLRVVLEGFPFCAVAPYERYCIEYSGRRLERVLLSDRAVSDYDQCLNATKTFVSRCKECEYRGRCGGFYIGYLQSHRASVLRALPARAEA
jgi:MoaA/NifB/PqqE/SkfB family radical SAM enzyme